MARGRPRKIPIRAVNKSLVTGDDNKWVAYKKNVNRLLLLIEKAEHFVDVYSVQQSHSVALTSELKSNQESILKYKRQIIECLEVINKENSTDIRYPQLEVDEEEIDVIDINCSKCGLPDEEDNDIIFCDKKRCNRAYHQNCLVPKLDVNDMDFADPEVDWFCWQCECMDDCINLINAIRNRNYSCIEDIFPELNNSSHEYVSDFELSEEEEGDHDYAPKQKKKRKNKEKDKKMIVNKNEKIVNTNSDNVSSERTGDKVYFHEVYDQDSLDSEEGDESFGGDGKEEEESGGSDDSDDSDDDDEDSQHDEDSGMENSEEDDIDQASATGGGDGDDQQMTDVIHSLFLDHHTGIDGNGPSCHMKERTEYEEGQGEGGGYRSDSSVSTLASDLSGSEVSRCTFMFRRNQACYCKS